MVFINKAAGDMFVRTSFHVCGSMSVGHLPRNGFPFVTLVGFAKLPRLLLPIDLAKHCAVQKPFALCQLGGKRCLSVFLACISLPRSELEQLFARVRKAAPFHLTTLLLAIIFQVCREGPILFLFSICCSLIFL